MDGWVDGCNIPTYNEMEEAHDSFISVTSSSHPAAMSWNELQRATKLQPPRSDTQSQHFDLLTSSFLQNNMTKLLNYLQ